MWTNQSFISENTEKKKPSIKDNKWWELIILKCD